jgi:hypothetical protein
MKWAFLSYIILNPLFSLAGVETRSAQTVCFQLSSILIFAIGMFFPEIRPIKRNKIHITLGVLIIAFIVAWLRSMNDFQQCLNYILGLLVYFTMIRTLKEEDLNFLVKGVLYMLILATIWLILQKTIGYDIKGTMIRNTVKPDRSSFFYHGSSMGMYYAYNIPLLLSHPLGLIGLLFLAPMKFAECYSAYAGIICAILFFYWFRKRIVFWILLIPILAGGVYFFNEAENKVSIDRRLPLWGVVIHRIMRTPIGHGLGSFSHPTLPGQFQYYSNPANDKIAIAEKRFDNKWNFSVEDSGGKGEKIEQLILWNHPHNEYIWIAYELGLQGLVIIGFLYYFIWGRFTRSKRSALTVSFMASLIAFAVFSFGQFGLHLSRVGFMLPVLFGGFFITTEE